MMLATQTKKWAGKTLTGVYSRGTFDVRSNAGISRRWVTTFAEGRPEKRFLTPLPDLDSPIMRTSADTIDQFIHQNPTYRDLIFIHPVTFIKDVTFFDLNGELWAVGVDATNPEIIYESVKAGAKILNVTPEKLADVACMKNLNHPSDSREENKKLHAGVLKAVKEIRTNTNGEMFGSVEITSHAKNPKFTGDDLMLVVKEQKLSVEVINPKVKVVSGANSGPGELEHESRTVRIDMDAKPEPEKKPEPAKKTEPAKKPENV